MIFLNTIKNIFFPESNKEIDHQFDLSNMVSLKIICLVTSAIEGLSLASSFFNHYEHIDFDTTIVVLTAIIILNLITAFAADLFIKQKIRGHKAAVGIAATSITIMAIFAMYVSYMNYKVDRQIIIFYAVNVCFISFIHIAPLFQFLFLLVEHSIFYYFLYNYDGAKGIIVPNAIIYLLLVIFASQISYHREFKFVASNYNVKLMAEKFEQKSAQDQLTGLLNRYALDSIPDYENPVRCQIAMADIDQFKIFNDKYGHLKGDEVLKITASTLLDVFRKKDCYRYGGDEFLVVAINLSEDAFRDRLALWEKKLAVAKIEDVEDPIKISYGVTSGIISSRDDMFKLIKEADEKLYSIKHIHHQGL